jgi:hypothetical protein
MNITQWSWEGGEKSKITKIDLGPPPWNLLSRKNEEKEINRIDNAVVSSLFVEHQIFVNVVEDFNHKIKRSLMVLIGHFSFFCAFSVHVRERSVHE